MRTQNGWKKVFVQKVKQGRPYQSGLLLIALGLLLSGSMSVKAAVKQEDLANPVMDNDRKCTYDMKKDKYNIPHSTKYHYVYFGNYPQREIKGEELTDTIIDAAYDEYGDAEIDGKKYRRISHEFLTIYKTPNDLTKERFDQKSTNGYRYYQYEPVKWKIYENNGDTLFLVSDRLVETQPYDMSHHGKWADCDLRKWLNYDGGEPQVMVGYDSERQYRYPGFLYYAFSKEEKERIQQTHVVQDDNPEKLHDGTYLSSGPDTTDKIFLLSYSEASDPKYGVCDVSYGCGELDCRPTDYARSQGKEDYDEIIAYSTSDFWLRTIGVDEGYAKPGEVMHVEGGKAWSGTYCGSELVRIMPALNADYTLNDCIRVSFETGTDTKIEDQILLGSNYAKEPMVVTEQTISTTLFGPHKVEGEEIKLQLKKEGYEFTGWYLDKACTQPYHFNRKLTKDTTLYAGWKRKPAAPAGLTGGVMKIVKTTSAMEYAASKATDAVWISCKEGITVVPAAGTWYVRYKETKDCIASEAAEIKVITAEQAVAAYVSEHNIPKATADITDETILRMQGENNVAGSAFGVLQARAGKVTSKTISLKWKSVKEADGYEIYGSKCGKKNGYRLLKTVSGGKQVSFKQKKLKKGVYYKYIVRAYKKVEGEKVSLAVSKTIHVATSGGKYGNVKSLKVKTNKKLKKKNGVYVLELKKNKKHSLKASEVKPSKKLKKHKAIAYESSDTSVAAVTQKGVVKGKKKGSCYIYVYTQNGMFQKIKVKVK
ncbi:MAG: InlB B-repeat-containing protein [Lachnospiraceae bacterium]|nr:InlB B-repeat-containing protein [Lachnospiraceae bacterium]